MRHPAVVAGITVLIIAAGYFAIKAFPSLFVEGEVYYLENGEFSVFFPEKPTYSIDPQEITPGQRVNTHSYSVGVGNLNASLSAGFVKNPFAGSNLTAEENLQRELEHTANAGGSRLISSNLTTYKGYPAIEYVIYNQLDPSLPAVYAQGMDVLKDGDLYMLGYGYPSGEEDKNLKRKFFSSLTFGKAWNSVDELESGNTFYTKSDNTNVRACGSTSCDVVATYPAGIGVFLPYASEEDMPEWVEVLWQDESGATKTGYVNKTTLERRATADVYAEAEATGTFCNGGYWDSCPAGQDFICPSSGGEAYCQSSQGVSSETVKRSDLPSVIKEWSPSVALIVCGFSSTGDVGFGSGFLTEFADGSIVVVTNKHVISDIYGYSANSCSIQIPGDGNNYYTVSGDLFQVSSLGYDWGSIPVSNGSAYFNNVARKNLPVCQQPAETGDNVVVLGYPSYAGSFTNPTATQGIISGYGEPYYTTSAKIEQGNSGGVAIQPDQNCYIGIPSAVRLGAYENLGRILNANKVFQLSY